MITNDIWTRVHEALDRRADPLDDPEIAAWLAQDPLRLAQYAELIEALRALPLARERAPRPLRRLAPWLGLVAAAALVFTFWPRGDAPLPVGDPCRVVYLRVAHVSPDGEATFTRGEMR